MAPIAAFTAVLNLQFTVSHPRETFRVLGLMKMDILNFTIQSLGTHLQEHNVPYEGKKFQELLDKLPCKLLGKGEENLTDESNPSESWRTPGSVLNRGDVNLLCWEPGQKEYPETLFRDQARLQEEQAQVNQFTIRAAVLLVTRAMCGSTFCGSPAFVARLKWVTKVLLEGALGRQQDSRSYPACTTATWASPKGQIKTITVKGNAVWHITGDGFTPSSVFSFPPMNRILKRFPQGLDSIQEELLEVGCRFGSMIHHSRQVFGLYYSEILRKVLLPDAGMDSF
uniref:Uncharacterized protein n=1 Tax=Strix occidentalis caurina TaxID=311401 RepID=A0A8D0KXB5_STROC